MGLMYRYQEITKEKYDQYKAKTYYEMEEFVRSQFETWILCGCGCYGCYLEEIDNKYYAKVKTGTSCD